MIANLDRRLKESESEWVREELERFMNVRPCHTCAGARLKPEALAVRLHGKSVTEVTALSVKEALGFFSTLPLTRQETEIARRILKEIVQRLGFMTHVGLDYLSLDRTAASLSGGEAQRIRLATQIGSKLRGVLYVLDEPSIGLHPRDNGRLLAGTLPLAEVYQYAGGTEWRLMKRLDHTPDVTYRRAWTMAEHLEHVSLVNHFLLLTIGKGVATALRRARTQPIPPGENDLSRLAPIADPAAFPWEPPGHMIPSGTK